MLLEVSLWRLPVLVRISLIPSISLAQCCAIGSVLVEVTSAGTYLLDPLHNITSTMLCYWKCPSGGYQCWYLLDPLHITSRMLCYWKCPCGGYQCWYLLDPLHITSTMLCYWKCPCGGYQCWYVSPRSPPYH